MESTLQKRVKKILTPVKILILGLGMMGLGVANCWISAWSENGTTLATMALVVLPTEENMKVNQEKSSPGFMNACYEQDTTLNILQHIGKVTYKIWISL
jgi:hypothetical protein